VLPQISNDFCVTLYRGSFLFMVYFMTTGTETIYGVDSYYDH